MKLYADTIDRLQFVDELERRQALAAMLDELDALGAAAAALQPDENPADVVDALSRLAAAPLVMSPTAHAAIRRVWGRLVMASRRHARLLAYYTAERAAAPLAPGVRPGVLTMATLLVALFAARRLLLPIPVVLTLPPAFADDTAAIGRPLPSPTVPPLPTDLLAEPDCPSP